jgi:predicted nucleotide-binding protein
MELNNLMQRLDGAADSAGAEKVESNQDWVTAAEAVRLLKPVFGGEYTAQQTICTRAHAGLIRARAEGFIVNQSTTNKQNIRKEFWWAEGAGALKQNWATGDFDTRVDHGETRLQAFGVSFLRADIEKMIRKSSPETALSPAAHLAKPRNAPLSSTKVFIVHGHAGIEQAVARFLAHLGLEPIILHEQTNQGRTIIEKFEHHSDVGFAVVLLTPDDVGSAKGAQLQPRARQNVILELGYFIGFLGRERVCALKQGAVELPSDVFGVVWEDLDAHAAWTMKLAKELREAGYKIDLNKV